MRSGRRRRVILVTGLVAAVVVAAAVAPVGAETGPAESVTSWLQVDAGVEHTCAVAATHALYCWGSNARGEGGDGTQAEHVSPVPVAGGATDWASVSAGDFTTCGIRQSGALYCWGSDGFGAIGDGSAPNDHTRPTQVGAANGPWAGVSAGGDGGEATGGAVCAVNVAHHLFCWGQGPLVAGGAGSANRSVPTEVAGGAANWASVSVGGTVACAVKTTGRLFCWGADFYGQVGDGHGAATTNRARPVAVANGDTNWTAVSAGWDHVCALRRSHRLYCWGGAEHGKLGIGLGNQAYVNRSSPTPVAGDHADWLAVAAGGLHTCGVRSSGKAYCWGVNWNGQIGGPTRHDDQVTLSTVVSPTDDWAASLAAGSSHNCALRQNAELRCWGWDATGQVGNGGDTAQAVFVPEPVVG